VSGKLAELLVEGAVVALASDVAGRTPVTFAGRPLLGSAGAAHLARKTGSPVVVLTAHPGPDGRPFVRLAAPLDPADHDSGEELLAAMLRLHESAVLDWPEATDVPLDRWGRPDAD
jgi:lauroyl/myristoyl acyltransferase